MREKKETLRIQFEMEIIARFRCGRETMLEMKNNVKDVIGLEMEDIWYGGVPGKYKVRNSGKE